MSNQALDKNQVRALHVLGQILAQIHSLANNQTTPRLKAIAALSDAVRTIPMAIANPGNYPADELINSISSVATIHRQHRGANQQTG